MNLLNEQLLQQKSQNFVDVFGVSTVKPFESNKAQSYIKSLV